MCGIVGYVGPKDAQPVLLEGLRRLEYRGYDSAGLATFPTPGAPTDIRRAVGKLAALESKLHEMPCKGSVGIGHTRWATHGRPSEENAHPHHADGVTVVHNGIIENHVELRAALESKGRTFLSDTDTELFAHLIALERPDSADLFEAVRRALGHVRGAFALAVLDEASPQEIIVAKEASPMVLGVGEGEMYIASDVPAVLKHTRRFMFLEDGDMGRVTADGVQLTGFDGAPRTREVRTLDMSPVAAEKAGHKHFMHKEIFEQPRAVTDTLRGRLTFERGRPFLDDVNTALLADIDRIVIVACGTSFHSGQVAKYQLEQLARVPVEVDLASEFRYRDPVLTGRTLVLGISQSGETADTLAALKEAKARGAHVMSVCNVQESAIDRLCRDSGGTLFTRAGIEIGVASTKAFVTQLVALHLLAIECGVARGQMDQETATAEMHALAALPRALEALLHTEDAIKAAAKTYASAHNMLFLGRGRQFPLALEGALKLKEISYIHAEGYAAGEMKHGPIALIDENMPVLVLVTPGPDYEKTFANLEEVRARGGRIIAVAADDDTAVAKLAETVLPVPAVNLRVQPVLNVLPLQLFAYHVADHLGTDVDQPRNLAKSVTVE